MRNLFVVLSLLALVGSGCGTIETHDPQSFANQAGVNRGVRTDYQKIADPGCMEGMCLPIWCIDMPFSFATDTLFLPFDAAGAIAKAQKAKPETQ